MARHLYKPPKGTLSAVFAIIGGIIATVAVFVAIPLSQKLNDILQSSAPPPPELTVEPPEETSFEAEPPPEEQEEEPEPEEMVEEASDLDLGLEIADLGTGTGGGFIMEIPKFGMKGGDDPFGGGEMDSAPVPTRKTPPVYPSSLLGKGIGGRVLVTCVVDASGKVVSTAIKQSSGHPDLDKAAINAVNKWAFRPGTKGGKKVKSTCVVPFTFEVKKN
jgi:protein TonB